MHIMQWNGLILASASPRRLDLMREAGLTFSVIPAAVEEVHEESTAVSELTRLNARLKAEWVAARHPEALVIGADTLVSIDELALGKPADEAEAKKMLRMLAGRTHVVGTAVALRHGASGWSREFLEETRVTFRSLTDAEIGHYLGLIHPYDKAGSYAAQEHGELIVERVEGDYTNVIGLPMKRLLEVLAEAPAALQV